MKKTIIAIIVVVLVALGIYYFVKSSKSVTVVNDQIVGTTTNQVNVATTTPVNKTETVIGKSAGGKDIIAYHYGTGSSEILFVGGIHGGYEWNTALLGFKTANYLKANPSTIPENIKVTVIPVLNPDGLFKVTGTSTEFTADDVSSSQTVVVAGRFNANNVDLNRNFDCDWQAKGVWQSKTVSGGDEVFSESESLAIKNYVETNKPKAVVVFYSAAGGVYSSSCHNGISVDTKALTNAYAKASSYTAYSEFDSYETTGDMTNWLAKIGVPSISVLLTNHSDTEWTKNLAGIKSILKYYSK